jgi:hypothetical protein
VIECQHDVGFALPRKSAGSTHAATVESTGRLWKISVFQILSLGMDTTVRQSFGPRTEVRKLASHLNSEERERAGNMLSPLYPAGLLLRRLSPLLARLCRQRIRLARKLSGDKLPPLGTAHDG